MQKTLEALGQMAIDGGIVRRADLTLELDNDALAKALEAMVAFALIKLPHVELPQGESLIAQVSNDRLKAILQQSIKRNDDKNGVDPKTISPHLTTIKIHHDRLAEGIARGIARYFQNIKKSADEEGAQFSYRIVPHDDGKKIQVEMDVQMLSALASGFRTGTRYQVDGIIDRSTIPQDREEMLNRLQELLGVDPETGETIIDGQELLKLMQAYFSKNHRDPVETQDDGVSQVDKDYEQFKHFFEKIPGAKLEREGDTVSLEIDMKQLSDFSKRHTDQALSQVKGITLTEENGEDAFVTTAKIDFKQLTQQAMAVAGDMLGQKNGLRFRAGDDTTVLTFNTDLMAADQSIKGIHEKVNEAVAQIGGMIAKKAIGAKPSSLLESVSRHFHKDQETRGKAME